MNKNSAIYPGSFDPVHLGHIDIITRSTKIFSSVIIAVAASKSKSPMFSVESRIAMLRDPSVEIISLDGLLVDIARQQNVFTIIRGLRAVSDFEFEFQMALMNRKLEPRLETVFLTSKEDYTYISSRIIKEVGTMGGDVSQFVPVPVLESLLKAVPTNLK